MFILYTIIKISHNKLVDLGLRKNFRLWIDKTSQVHCDCF